MRPTHEPLDQQRRTTAMDYDRHAWGYYDNSNSSSGGGGGGTAAAPPLPPLRSTLYRDDEPPASRAWVPPVDRPQHQHQHQQYEHADRRVLTAAYHAPPPHHAQHHPQQQCRPGMDLFAHLPLASTVRGAHARVQRLDDDDDAPPDDEDDYFDADDHYRSRPYPPPHGRSGSSSASAAAIAAANKKRSRRMSNSERGKLYRSRRKEYVETLEEQVEGLKQQIEEMRVNGVGGGEGGGGGRALTAAVASPYDASELSRDRSRAGFARIVCEYFSLFEHGVPRASQQSPPNQPQQLQVVASAASDAAAAAHAARLMSFVQSLVDPNMRFGDNFGVQMLLEQWERYSAYHAFLQYDLNAIEVLASEPEAPQLLASATLRVRFSRTTIEKVFPHVLWNEPLVQRLIGLEVEYPVTNKFYFGADGKIKRYETEVDFVGAFTRALGSTRDAMLLVGNALIKEHSRIGPEDEDALMGRSPLGSADGSSSRSSTHSQSPTMAPSPDEAAARPPHHQHQHQPLHQHHQHHQHRYKQSEARRSEGVADDDGHPLKPPDARRFPVGAAFYESDVPPPHRQQHPQHFPHHHQFARAAGEPQPPLHYAARRPPLDRSDAPADADARYASSSDGSSSLSHHTRHAHRGGGGYE